MSYHARAGIVIYAKNVARVSAFYAGVVGLEVAHAEEGHVVLESPMFQLVIVAVPEHVAASIELSTPPIRREDTPIKPVFFVESIEAARVLAPHLGGELNPIEGEWKFQEHRVCDGHGPEGNVVQFREDAKD
jgi:catechol 2,3-dioxygenase-like lactoylglutathione lyase family enzyme